MNAVADAYGPSHALTADEAERGWVEHHCPEHGFLVACTPRAMVSCECGLNARILRHGRIVNEATLKPTGAKARTLNTSGHPYVYGCGDCREDFGGRTLQKRHRVGRGSKKRCLSSAEMVEREWFRDERGRWRSRGSFSAVTSTTQEAF